jgi:hypothetical protein
MGNLENGMLVQHASLGAGKIVALDANAVHVFFATSETKFATKLRLPMALSFLSPCSTADERLDGLPAFVLDPKTGRYGRAPSAAAKAPRAKAKAKPRLRAVKAAADSAATDLAAADPAAVAPANDPSAPAPSEPTDA